MIIFRPLTSGAGIHNAVAAGDVVVLRSATLDEHGGRWRLPNGEELDRHGERALRIEKKARSLG